MAKVLLFIHFLLFFVRKVLTQVSQWIRSPHLMIILHFPHNSLLFSENEKYNEKNIRRDEHMKTKLSYFATSFMRKLEVWRGRKFAFQFPR